jgi:hypothetical protein
VVVADGVEDRVILIGNQTYLKLSVKVGQA